MRTPRRRSRCARLTLCIVAGALLTAIASDRSLAQESTPALTMTAALEWSQVYRPGGGRRGGFESPTPADQPMDGTAVLPLGNERAPAVMRLPVSIPQHSTVSATLWGYFLRA